MKILITGGGGFLGSSLAKRLYNLGNEVTILGRKSYPEFEGIYNCIRADVRDLFSMEMALVGQEIVFHMAATPGIWGDYEDFYRTDVHGTENVISACKKNNIKKLIYTSSPSVIFGKNNIEDVDEKTPYSNEHLCHYSKTKAIAELKVIKANGYNGLSTVCIRPHLIWGPGDPHLIPRIINRAKNGKLFRIGEGNNKVDMIYIDNAVEAHIKASEKLKLDSPVAGSCYFVSDGKPILLWAWIEALLINLKLPAIKKSISFRYAYLMGAILEVLYKILRSKKEPLMTRFLAAQLAKSHYFNINNAKKDFGYEPLVTNEEGVKRLVNYYFSRQES